jgi:hypothetical protein
MSFDAWMPPVADPACFPRTPRPTARLTRPDLGATRTIPVTSVVATASLCLPARLVRARAAAFAERTRALGAPHSLRVWREAHQAALIQLAREASGVALGVPCQRCIWRREADTYHVTARFASLDAPLIH